MPSLYEKLSPGAPPTASGSPGYEGRIVERTKANLMPQYANAVKQARQNMANRGLYRSGIALQTEGGIGEQYRNQLGQAANEAAISGADLAEKNRQRQEERGWNKEDLMAAIEERKRDRDTEREIADADRWANLIGSATGAVTNLAGKGLYRLFNKGGQGTTAPAQP